LTPAEVNQLPDDDGILMVGGQLPYRARKVRYYLDRRFRGRDKVPAPDRPEDQARELLPLAPNDWEGMRAEPPPEPTETAKASANAPAFAPSAPSESAPAAADVWAAFFDGQAANEGAIDDAGGPAPTESNPKEGLPL
jgi:type IV secretory pathway TraG/TraD family ATPase VirD4